MKVPKVFFYTCTLIFKVLSIHDYKTSILPSRGDRVFQSFLENSEGCLLVPKLLPGNE